MFNYSFFHAIIRLFAARLLVLCPLFRFVFNATTISAGNLQIVMDITRGGLYVGISRILGVSVLIPFAEIKKFRRVENVRDRLNKYATGRFNFSGKKI